MSHHVYTTEAFVLESAPSGEANKSYSLFTEEFGRIYATAQGVRLQKSKLRFNLQDYSHVSLSVVRGKEVWRITNAREFESLYTLLKDSREAMRVLSQIFQLLKRLVPTDEKHEALFISISESLQFLKEIKYDTKEIIAAFEHILVIRILEHLGYMKRIEGFQQFISDPWSKELLEKMVGNKKRAVQEINAALRATHL